MGNDSGQLKTFFIGVKGVIVKDNKILLLKKSGDHTFWDVPGGRMNEGETPEMTLRRELREELPGMGDDIRIGKLLGAHVLDKEIKDGVGLALHFYCTEVTLGDMKLSAEHSDYRWMTFAEARAAGIEGIAQVIDSLEAANGQAHVDFSAQKW